MRRAPRFKDSNHAELRTRWRALGASWLDIIPIEGGEPDALLGWRGVTRLVEIKDPLARVDKRKPRATQLEWHRAWKGHPVAVVETLADCVRLFP
jgi:hypothetical protein